jgi:hypothetical protein
MTRYFLLLLCAPGIYAGSILISSAIAIPAVGVPAAGSFALQGGGSGVIVPGNQVVGPAPTSSVSLSGSGVSGSASVSGPSSITDLFSITASGTLISSTPVTHVLTQEGAVSLFSYQPTASISGYNISAPSLTMLFNPSGFDGYASFSATSATLGANYYVTSLDIIVALSGNSGSASFIWDAATGAMALNVSPGVSGSFEIYTQDGTDDPVYLLDYEFQTNLQTNMLSVTTSMNSLDLALPTVGFNPDFTAQLSAISATVPTINPASYITELVAVQEVATLTNNAPEPATLGITLAGLGVVISRVILNDRRKAVFRRKEQ